MLFADMIFRRDTGWGKKATAAAKKSVAKKGRKIATRKRGRKVSAPKKYPK